MGLADALQAGDIVTISAPEGNYYIVSKQSNGTCIFTTSLDDDSVEQSVSLEVLRVGKYALFRSALADNKVLQATRDIKAPLTFANYNTGSWEQWDVLGESLISCLLVNRQYPTRKLTVKIDVVHHLESSTSSSQPPVVEAKSVATDNADDASRGAELKSKPSGGVASIPIVGLVASAVGAGAGAVLGVVTGRLSRQNSRAPLSQGNSLTASPEKSARFNRDSGASDEATVAPTQLTAAVPTAEQALDAAELNYKLEQTKKELFSTSNPFATSMETDSTITDAEMEPLSDATNIDTRPEELQSNAMPTTEEPVIQSEQSVVEQQQPLAEPAQATIPAAVLSELESTKFFPMEVPAVEETVKQLPSEMFEPAPSLSEALASRAEAKDFEQPALAESIGAATQPSPAPVIFEQPVLAESTGAAIQPSLAPFVSESRSLAATDIAKAVDEGEQLVQAVPAKTDDLAEEAALMAGASQVVHANPMTDAGVVAPEVDRSVAVEAAPMLSDAPVVAAEITALDAELPATQTEVPSVPIAEVPTLPIAEVPNVPIAQVPSVPIAEVQPEALPTITSVPQPEISEKETEMVTMKPVRDPLDERVKLVVIDDPSPVGDLMHDEQQVPQPHTVQEEAPRTFLGTSIAPVSTPAVESIPSGGRAQAPNLATPATGPATVTPSMVSALQLRADNAPVERMLTPPTEGVRARRASEQVMPQRLPTPLTEGARARRASEQFLPQDFLKPRFGLQPAEAPTAVADQKAPASSRVTVVGDTPTTEGQWTKSTEPKRKSKRFMCGCFG
eukprot:jgi/Chlat1/8750/Chrsp9S08570